MADLEKRIAEWKETGRDCEKIKNLRKKERFFVSLKILHEFLSKFFLSFFLKLEYKGRYH